MNFFLRIMSFMVTVFLTTAFVSGELSERIEFSGREVSLPSQLEDIKLYKDADGFHIIKNDKIYDVQNCLCDTLLQKMTRKQLEVFLGRKKPQSTIMTLEKLKQIYSKGLINVDDKKAMLDKFLRGGYISVSQMSDGEYVLRAHMGERLLDKKDVAVLTAAAAANIILPALLAGTFCFIGDDTKFKRTIKQILKPALIILITSWAGFVGGGIMGAGGAIINKKKDTEVLAETLLGAGYGGLIGTGTGLGIWLESEFGFINKRHN